MKTKLMALAAFFTFCIASAQQQIVDQELNSAKGVQFQKGDMFIEGSLKISTASNTDYFAFTPKFGYLLNDKFAIGANLNFGNEKDKGAEAGKDVKSTVFGAGGFARYYFLHLDSKRFKAYTEAGLGFGRNTKKSPTIDETNNSITANIAVGLNYFITKNIAATFTLANVLSYNSVSPEDGSSSNTFELNLNLFENIFAQPQFGLLYKF
ncbi:outer membrane beta-barrel protein [Flavobacterium sp. MC2016-06]|uniref:outer membrane beta-barrel protein n=1 Tax=Flavobacterium sp. MC2016-06 TaxID=2676308 RepID=UPI0012BB103F|nr:outer membrane beta-barrel protein [Flavobacterium sp. MC2016-06]MBU3860085.1 porin family protein [Flavobacterium sp. MC2016-06]